MRSIATKYMLSPLFFADVGAVNNFAADKF